MFRVIAAVLVLVVGVSGVEAKSKFASATTVAKKSDPDKKRFKSAKTFYSGLEIERY